MLPRWLCVVGLLVGSTASASAQPPKDPLRFVPSLVEAVLKVERPRDVLDLIEKNELFQQVQKLAGVREFYDSTNFQRLYQLIAYFEKELGQSKEELLEDLSSGGLVVAARFSPPAGALLVIQAKDEAKLRRFTELALDLVAKELERQESKDRVVRSKYQGFDVGLISRESRDQRREPKESPASGSRLSSLDSRPAFAIADAALLVASDEQVLKIALDTFKMTDRNSILKVASFVDARKEAPTKALAWTWFHLEAIRAKIPNFKNGLDAAALDPFQMVLFGGLADLVKRSPYVSAALTREGEGDDYQLRVTMPRGREGMSALSHFLLPTDGLGSLPPLVPPRTIGSTSYFADLGQFWDQRVAILGEKNAKGLDEGDKNLTKLLGGIKLSKLLNAMGTHHRIVATQPTERPYKIKPTQYYPAIAVVVDMRDPSFAKDMNSIFRTGALLATFSVGLHLKEETYSDCDMVSYFFSETKKVEGDPTGIRFNFTPTYVTVGNYFVMSGTAELARDLIDTLKAEPKSQPRPATMRTQLHSSGLAAIIKANEDLALTQLILSQALPPNTAKEELRAILQWVEQLGSLQFEQSYGANDFRYDILWQAKKK